MKTTTLFYKFCLFLTLFSLLITYSINAQTITSTTTGGTWNTPATWIGGVVPGAGSNVIIAGSVYLNGNFTCASITINSTGSFINDTYYNPTLTVTGSFVNNGKVSSHPTSGYQLYLSLQGNIENNGIWTVKQTSLSGSANQTIKQGIGKRFEGYFLTTDAAGDVLLASDVTFYNNTWDLSKSRILTNGHKLTTVNYLLNDGFIVSNDNMILRNTSISSITFNGNYKIGGNLYIRNGNVFNDIATINDTILNDTYYNPTLTINGKIINNGRIINHPTSGYRLYINSFGDIENNGLWQSSQTTLSSTGNQKLKQSQGKFFEGYFVSSDSIGDIILESDITMLSNTWALNRSKIVANNYSIITQNYTLSNGKIYSTGMLNLKNSIVDRISFDGNYVFEGKIRIQNKNFLLGTATIKDTIQNDSFYNPTLTIVGKIVNNGQIINHPTSGYKLYLDILSDIENNGIWRPQQTNFSSEKNQTIKQTAGKHFEGYFVTTDSIGDIILDSDVSLLSNTWALNRAKIVANNFSLITQNYVLSNGRVYSTGKLNLKNSIADRITFDGNYVLEGKLRIQNKNFLLGTATLKDTIQNDSFYNPTLTIIGKIINNGQIINHPTSGYKLYLNILSDIENNGIWRPQQTSLSAKIDQKLKQASGKTFEGYFLSIDSIGDVILLSDISFKGNKWDMANTKLRTNGFNFNTLDYNLNDGQIISNEKLILRNTIFSKITLNGTYSVEGKVRIQNNNIFKGIFTLSDTILNDDFYNSTLDIRGKIVNNGKIINHPSSGYKIYLRIFGDVVNNGKWTPHQTTIAGTNIKTISQKPGVKFESYFTTSDTICKINLGSNVMFGSNTWDMNKSKLYTKGFILNSENFQFNNGVIFSNDSLNLKNTKIASMKINGDFKLKGKLWIQNGNIFSGKTTNIDTIYNDSYYNAVLTVYGDLVNNGVIRNHPSTGYRLFLSANGNLENNKTLSIAEIYLYGANPREISGLNSASVNAKFIVDDPIIITGNSLMPNLNFSNKPTASCTIDKESSLTLNSLPNATKIKNNGRVSVSQDIDNTSTITYNFFAASVSSKAKNPLNKLTIDNYGNQFHPTATGTIKTWWRLRNTPQLFTDSLNWLKLNYSDDILNGIVEDSIKVFHSPNAGLSWKRIKTGFTIDKTANIVTINKAPSSGHYLLASSAIGITSFQPLVESAEPRFGGNLGQLTMYLFGAGFKSSSKVILRKAGQSDIIADTTYVTDVWGESLLSRFDLKNKPIGQYDVIIETKGEKTLILPSHFEIVNGQRSEPWSTLSGRDRFLLNRWSTFNIAYGNTANTDALGTVLVFVINDLPGLEIEFPDINIVQSQYEIEQGPNFTRFNTLDLYYTSTTLSGYEGTSMRIYPFYIPYIAAGSANNTRVKVKLTGQGSLKMDSWLLDPLFERIEYLKSTEPMPAEVRLCITAAAMKAWYGGMVGMGSAVIPGLACWGVVDKVIDPVGHVTPESMKPEGKDTWGSWLWKGVSIMGSAVQCGASFVPGVGQALNLGIAMVNTAIDMKDGYDANEGCWRKFRKKSQGKLDSKGVASFDPNEKAGPQGYTSERYISKEGNLNYTIFFENLKTAGASALEVFITDTLDTKKFDFSTFSFNSVSFGETTAKVQKFAKEFKLLVDLYPKKNIIVQIHGKLDTIKGIVTWDFHSLDRITMELTEDPDGGFLPPNKVSPEGEGNVTFSCQLKKTVNHGDVISNRASIVFDFNKPIITNTFTNKIDNIPPVSSVTPLNLTQKDSIFSVSWTGSDSGSKISKINVFVSVNNEEYKLWKVASKPDKADFIGKNGNTYRFYSIATDSIGFSEAPKTKAEASTTMDIKTGINGIDLDNQAFNLFPNPSNNKCNIEFVLKQQSEVLIELSDITGRRIKIFKDEIFYSGTHILALNHDEIPDGVYLIKLSINNKAAFQKLIIRR